MKYEIEPLRNEDKIILDSLSLEKLKIIVEQEFDYSENKINNQLWHNQPFIPSLLEQLEIVLENGTELDLSLFIELTTDGVDIKRILELMGDSEL
jgi:hypothetical protein